MTSDGTMPSNQPITRIELGAEGGFAEAAYCWEDRRLIETYRRLSRDLKRRGFETETVHRMGCVEVELRDRDINPDKVIEHLWD